MRAPREVTFKWTSYALCAAVLLWLRMLLLGSHTVWGMIPFLPPLILASVGSCEEIRPTVIFGLSFGIVCDLLFSAPFPCLYTVAFTVSALLIGLLSHRFLQSGVLCAVLMTVLTFAVLALLNMLVLGAQGHANALAMLSVFVRETLISLLFLPLAYLPVVKLHRFFTL